MRPNDARNGIDPSSRIVFALLVGVLAAAGTIDGYLVRGVHLAATHRF